MTDANEPADMVATYAWVVLCTMMRGDTLELALALILRPREVIPNATQAPPDPVARLVRDEIGMALSAWGVQPSNRPEDDLEQLAEDDREEVLQLAARSIRPSDPLLH